MKNYLFIIDNTSFCLADKQKLHLLYSLCAELKNSELLLLDSAVLMVSQNFTHPVATSLKKSLNASELFGISKIFALKRDLARFKVKKSIPISRLSSLKNFMTHYDAVIPL